MIPYILFSVIYRLRKQFFGEKYKCMVIIEITMKEIEIVDDPEIIKIVVEETRSKILKLLRFRDMTISEIASILNKDVSTIFRHMKKLEKAGIVRVTGERKVHNIPEKVYGRTIRTIILAPEAYEKSAVFKRFQERMYTEIKEALTEMGYVVEDDKFLKEFILKMEEIPLEDLNRLTRDMDWNNLRLLKAIIVLMKMDRESIEELKRKVHKPRT